MTFKDIALKNFKANSKKYFAYFLGSSFSIMVFFMYSTLVFSEGFAKGVDNPGIKVTMAAALLILGVFSVVFISYAHSSFIKSRKKEFGLYLSLGMTGNDIGKLIKIENGLIGLLSLGLGLIAGTVFSRLFFMAVVTLLDLEGIDFALSIKSYLLTAVVFLCIFLIVVTFSRLITKRLEISQLLRESRKSKGNKVTHPLLGILGFVMVVAAFIMFFYHLDGKLFPDQNYWMLAFLAIALFGLYLVVAQFGSLVLSFIKTRKSSYYKNLLPVTELNHKFNLNKQIIYLITILSAVVVFFIGIAYSLYQETLKVATEENPFHLAYVVDKEGSEPEKEQIKEVLNSAPAELTEEKSVDFVHGGTFKNYNGKEAMMLLPAIALADYNALSGDDLKLNSNEAATLILTPKPERNKWHTAKTLKYQSGEKQFIFDFKTEVSGVPLNHFDNFTFAMVIINDRDFAGLKEATRSEFVKEIKLVNFEDWRAIEGLVEEIEVIQASETEDTNANPMLSSRDPKPISRIQVFNQLKQQNSFFLFMTGFIGFLFFITSGSVLYFKLNNDLEETKTKYRILAKIGIQDQEMKAIIATELKLIFFLPLVLGSLLGYAFIWILTVNVSIREDIMLHTLVIALVYFLFQSIYYLLAKRKQVEEVINSAT